MNTEILARTALSIAVVLVAASGANAQTINVNIKTVGEDPQTDLAGPAGGAGEFWDQRSSVNETGLRENLYGVPTNVGYSFTYSGSMAGPWNWTAGGDSDLGLIASGMANFARGVEEPQQFVINGLTEGDTFDVWIASSITLSLFDEESNQRAKGVWSTPNVTTTVGSQTIDNVFDVNGSTWVAGNNYVLFENIVVDASGELVFDGFSIDEIDDEPPWDNRLPVNGFQLIDPDPTPPTIMTLQVNTSSGVITLLGHDTESFTINSYQITSALGQLDPTDWNSLELQNFPASVAGDFNNDESINSIDLTDPVDGWEARFGADLDGSDFLVWQRNFGSSGTPTGWEEGEAVSPKFLGEAMLVGDSTIAAGASIDLGPIYTGPAEGDLDFVYRDADGTLLPVIISYVGAAAAAVPEPSSLALVAVGLLGLGCRRKQA